MLKSYVKSGVLPRVWTVLFATLLILTDAAEVEELPLEALPEKGMLAMQSLAPLTFTELPAGSQLFHASLTNELDGVGVSSADDWPLDAEAGDRLTVRVETTVGAARPQVRLLNAAGQTVASVNGGTSGIAEIQNVLLASPGTYRVRVYTDHQVSEYRLRVGLSRGPALEMEANDSVASANAFAPEPGTGTFGLEIGGALVGEDVEGDYFSLGFLSQNNAINLDLFTGEQSTLSAGGVMLEIFQEGTETPVASTTNPTLSFAATADAVYFVKVSSATDRGLFARYFLTATVTDDVVPSVTASSLPGNTLSSSSIYHSFTVTFSEDMSAAAVNDLANYSLRNAGADGSLDTPDDEIYAIVSPGYTTGQTATFPIVDGPLQPGNYRFTASSTVTDRAGNPLTPAFVLNFTIERLGLFQFEARSNNTIDSATTLSLQPAGAFDRSFRVGSVTGTASNPLQVRGGDLNGDGKADLVVAHHGSHTAGVWLGQGEGTFAPRVDYAVGNNPWELVLGDFDGDGQPDVATVNETPDTVSVLLNNGDGTLASAVHSAVESNPRALSAGDFNEDGKLDLAVANYSADSFSILLGNGDGTFATAAHTVIGGSARPHSIASGDFNEDGHLDLAVANHNIHTVNTYLGNGDGTFGTALAHAVANNPISVTAGDLNGDGFEEVVVVPDFGNVAQVLQGAGDGTFGAAVSYGLGGNTSNREVRLLDVDEDGWLDLVVARGNELLVRYNLGEWAFMGGATYAGGSTVRSAELGDFDGDGYPDLAVVASGNSQLLILAGRREQMLAEDPVGSGIRTGAGRGNIAGSSDLDYWSFSGRAGERLVVASETPGHGSSSGLRYVVERPDGGTLVQFGAGSNGTDQSGPAVLPVSGTYTVRVDFNYGYTGEYRFRVTLAPEPWQLEGEGNNSVGAANLLAMSREEGVQRAKVLGYIRHGDTSDVFGLVNQTSGRVAPLLDLPEGTEIRLILNQPASSPLDATLEVLDSEGVVVATDADYVIPSGETGRYFVRVTGLGGTTGLFSQYLLGIELNVPADVVTPVITGDNLPTEGTGITGIFDRFRLDFSEEMRAETVNDPANYEWRSAGVDGLFATSDDELYSVTVLSSYASGLSANFIITDGPLQPGMHRLTVFPALQDTSLNAMAAPHVRTYAVAGVTGFLTESRSNETIQTADTLSVAPLGAFDRSFRVGSVTGTASNPLQVRGGDLNGDGKADLVVAHHGSHTAGVWLGQGEGTFAPRVDYAVGNNPWELVLGDFDGDGQPDVATVNETPDTVSVLLNNGDGTLASAVHSAVESNPRALSAGDFNEDGKLDLAVANYSADSFSILLGNGDGTFATAAHTVIGGSARPHSIASGDFNEDGHLDLAVANHNIHTVNTYLGNGDGTFGTALAHAVANNPISVTAGDLNGDGFEEVVVVPDFGNVAQVLQGAGDGTFGAAVSYGLGGNTSNREVRLLDVDEDGWLDLVVARGNELLVRYNLGEWAFMGGATYAGGSTVRSAELGDFDGDGYPDLAVVASGNSQLLILAGRREQMLAEDPVGSGIRTGAGRGNIAGSSDLDYWSFSGRAGERLVVASETPGHGSSSGLRYVVERPDGGTLVQFGAGSNGTDQSGPAVLPVSGTYTVRVDFNYGYTGEYRFRVTLAPEPWQLEGEGNNSVGAANLLAMSREEGVQRAKVLGYIRHGDTGDVFGVPNLPAGRDTPLLDLPEGTEIRLTLNQPASSPLDPTFEVLDATGATLSTDANYTVPAGNEGRYYVRVQGAAGTTGLFSQYLLEIELAVPEDSEPPAIVANSLPDQTTVPQIVDRFSLGFSEDMLAQTVNNPANYELRSAGADEIFDNADDEFYSVVISPAYVSGLSANYLVTDGPLQPGQYRFTAGTALQDTSLNAMAAPHVRTYAVAGVTGFLTESRSNETIQTADTLSVAPLGAFDRSFRVGSVTGTASNPLQVRGGDLNGDGKADLVVAHHGSHTAGVWLGQGEGTFAPRVDYAVGNNPWELVLGDFDGDGQPDVATVNETPDTVSVLLNNGDGTLASAVHSAVESNPRALSAGDFNEDGKLDLAVANYSADSFSILLGNGDGTFATAAHTVIGGSARPHSIASGDFNEDGHLDLAVANHNIHTVNTYLGNGDGTFGTALAHAVANNPISVTAGDLNGDGFEEVVVVPDFGNVAQVLQGAGDGTFGAAVSYGLGGNTSNREVRLLDVDEDGWLDLVVARGNELLVRYNLGEWAFMGGATYAGGSTVRSAELGDFDGDGYPDLAVVASGNSQLLILAGRREQMLAEDPVGSGIRTGAGRGNIAGSSDLDYWSFSGRAGERLVVASETPGHGSSSGLRYVVERPDGGTLVQFGAGSNGTDQSGPAVLPVSGTYTVRVDFNYGYTGEYRFRVTLAPEPWQLEGEGNNSVGAANLLAMSREEGVQRAKVLGYIRHGDTGDVFGLGNVGSSTEITIAVEKPETSPIIPMLEILDNAGTAVASAEAGVTDLSYTVPVEGAGLYYVRVQGSSGTSGLFSQYMLDVELADTVPPIITADSLPVEGSTTVGLLDRFSLTFSEDMMASTVNDPANYELRSAGTDGLFDSPDDIVLSAGTAPAYASGLVANYFVPVLLAPGDYRFTASMALTDRFANGLSVPFVRNFTIGQVPGLNTEIEPNNEPAGATALALSSPQPGLISGGGRGYLSSGSDLDFWTFEAEAGDQMMLAVQNPGNPSNSGLQFRVLRPDGSTLTEFVAAPNGLGQSDSVSLPVTGTYGVRVAANYSYTGEHRFRVSLYREGLQVEQEPNDSLATASALTLTIDQNASSATAVGFTRLSNDLDYFNLGSIPAGMTVFLKTRQPASSPLIPVVSLYTGGNTYLPEAGAGRPFDSVAEVQITQSETYYALVRASGETGGLMSEYLLDVLIMPTAEVSFPNLQVTVLTIPVTTGLESGDSFSFSYTAQNVGSLATQVSSWFDQAVLSANPVIDDGDLQLNTYQRTGALQPGENYTVNDTVILPDGISGPFYLIVKTDFTDTVNEFILEGDNETASENPINIALSDYPDLAVENLILSGPDENQSYTLSWDSFNRGSTAVATPFSERVRVRNQTQAETLFDQVFPVNETIGIGANISRAVDFIASVPGVYLVEVITDSGNEIFEFNENGHTAAEQNSTERNFSITAFFTVSLAAAPSEGGTVLGSGRFPEGTQVIVQALPNTTEWPYFFVDWTENGVFRSANSEFTFVLNRDRQLVAKFALPTFQIIASNDPAGAGTVTGAGTYLYGTTNTLVAHPVFGYQFDHWIENGEIVSTSPTLVSVVAANRSLVAHYSEANLEHVVTTATQPSGLVAVSGGGTYQNGQSASISAPTSVVVEPDRYTFKRFLMNGAPFGTESAFEKTFSTTDPTNMHFVAEYEVRGIRPIITHVTRSAQNPVPATNNFVLTFRFDRAMQTSTEPLVELTNSANQATSPVAAGGTWLTTIHANDTYRTPAITLGSTLEGTNAVIVSGALDLDGAELALTNAAAVVVDTLLPAISVVSAAPEAARAVITWSTDEPATSRVEYGADSNYGSSSPISGLRVTSHRVILSGLTPGVDYHFRVRSRDQAGNESVSSDMTFATLLAPDLTIGGLAIQPESLVSGAEVTILWNTMNAGLGEAAGSWHEQLTVSNLTTGQKLLERNVTFDASQVALESGGTRPRQQIFTLPQGPVGAGELLFQITADAYGVVFESNLGGDAEVNNTVSAIHASVLPAYPDLQVSGLAVSPVNPKSGETISLTWNVVNAGSADLASSFHERVRIRNLTTGETLRNAMLPYDVQTVENGVIQPGQSRQRQFSFALPNGSQSVGQLEIEVLADAQGTVFEYNQGGTAEVNNTAVSTVISTLAAYPDLVVENIVAPASAAPGEQVEVSWTVHNQGDGEALAPWSEQVFLADNANGLNGRLLASFSNADPLGAQQTAPRTHTVTIPSFAAGNHWLIVKVDSGNAVFEHAETNNVSTAAAAINVPLSLTLGLGSNMVRENAGAAATMATVRRNGDLSSALLVNLASSDNGEATVPASVSIPAEQSTVTFPVAAVPDALADGDQPVTITASAAGHTPATAQMTVIDVDNPQLTLSTGQANLQEGAANPAAIATLTRNASLASPLVVVVSSENSARIQVPQTVTIPAGAASVTFGLDAVDNIFVDGPQEVRILATADGFLAASVRVQVADNDIPALSLSLADQSVSEGAPVPATIGAITRNPVTSQPLVVMLTSSRPARAKFPAKLTIPAGEASISFNVEVVDNTVVDGKEVVTAFATALSGNGTSLEETVTSAFFEVLDNDGPTLSLHFAGDLVAEGGTMAANVSRNTETSQPLEVTLASSAVQEALPPQTVTIPAGQASVLFTILGVADGVTDGVTPASITASATGFNSAVRVLQVTDIDLPDLRVGSVNAASTALTGARIDLDWVVRNDGLAPVNGSWVDRVYLSSRSGATTGILLKTIAVNTIIPVGGSYARTEQIQLPYDPGQFWISVVTDADASVEEGSEVNNTASAGPINLQPAYTANVETDVTTAPNGTPIPLRGQTIHSVTGQPVSFEPATIRIRVNGTRRLIHVFSDALGNFEQVFQPLANEAGEYSIGADHPGVEEDPVQDAFTLVGMQGVPGNLSLRLTPNLPVSGKIELRNRSSVPLSGITLAVINASPGLDVDLVAPATLPGSGVVELDYSITSTDETHRVESIALEVRSAEGAILEIPARITVVPLRPQLVANPSFLARGMLRGQQSIVAFDVRNTGGAPSGNMNVILPELTWMSLLSDASVPSLEPGESTTVTLALSPAADLPLTRYDGTIGLGGNQTGISVPFQFRAISDAVGDLLVTVEDEYTYFVATAPNVTNATVRLRDPINGEIIAEGETDDTGKVLLSNIAEGDYAMEVSADRHNPFRAPVKILPGIQNESTAFISRQTVTYRWTVVPIEIEDTYRIVLESVFETEVPIPNVVVEDPFVMPLVVPGEDTQFEIKLTNQGLIEANGVEVTVPDHPTYEIVPLVKVVDVLPAKSSVTIPVIIRQRGGTAAAAAHDGSLHAASGGDCSVGVHPCLPKIPMGVHYYYVCGPNNVLQRRQVDLSPVCVAKDAYECIKNTVGAADAYSAKGNLAKAACEILEAVISCAGVEMSECQAAALKIACRTAVGAATGGLAGAGAGAASGLGDSLGCLCQLLSEYAGTINIQPSPRPGIQFPGGSFSGWTHVGTVPYAYNIGGGGTDCGTAGARSLHAFQAEVMAGQTVVRSSSEPAGVCARVRIRIEQEAVMTRSAFLGSLEIDNEGSDELTGVRVNLDFRDENGNSAADKFAIRPPQLSGLSDVNGAGVIAAHGSGSARYTFVPTRDAAPVAPQIYHIGGTLRYFEGGEEVVVPLLSSTITVFPEANLELRYFQQRDVYGDDPFTDELEPSEPFALGLLVKNTGAGAAKNFRITSAQPEIIENEKGLLIDFKIIGTQVGDQETSPSLTANLGTIPPGESQVAAWFFTSSLQGKFIEYSATFEHVDSLGFANLSLIDSVEIHELIHVVRSDRPDTDTLPDFLVNDDIDPQNLPDTLYFSDGTAAVVNLAGNAATDGLISDSRLQAQLTASMTSGWNYLRLPDPGPGFRLVRAVRSDGKQLRPENVWTTDRTFPSTQPGPVRENVLHLLDYEGTGSYTLYYRPLDSSGPRIEELPAVTPFLQTAAIGQLDVILSEPVDLATFDHADLQLMLNGEPVDTGELVITHLSGTSYRISGLTPLTAQDGNYELTVDARGILGLGGGTGENSASIQWAKASSGPVVLSLSSVAPDPRDIPVSEIEVTFSHPINPATFGLANLVLTRDGGANLINNAVTISSVSSTSFRVSGLAAATMAEGEYQFRVLASGVQDTSGNPGSGSVSTQWRMDGTGPSLDAIERLATNPRNIVVQSLDVWFTEEIDPSSFNFNDLTLTRNNGLNLITSVVEVTQISPIQYRIRNFNWVVGLEGVYTLTVDASGIQDLVGNAGSGSIAETWAMKTSTPTAPTDLYITPDLGISDLDGLTSSLTPVLHGTLSTAGLTVRVYNQTQGVDLGIAALDGTSFSIPLVFADPGVYRLRVYAVDDAANVSADVFFDLVIETTRPELEIAAVTPNPRATAVESIGMTFSELINPMTFTHGDLSLTRDGGTNLISDSVVLTNLSGAGWQVGGLAPLTAVPGTYELTVHLPSIEDVAGNTGTAPVTRSWVRAGENNPPVLAAIADLVASPGVALVFTNSATDLNDDLLTYSLDAGAPAGARIDPETGVFSWTPALNQAFNSYTVTVIVTDGALAPLSDSQTFTITVQDYIAVTAGEVVMRAGDTDYLPLDLDARGVANVSFVLAFDTARFTAPAVVMIDEELATATLEMLEANQMRIAITALPGKVLNGAMTFAALELNANSSQGSAFVPFAVSDIAAAKLGGASVPVTFAEFGRAVIIDEQPLLEATLAVGSRGIVLYGKEGTTYGVEYMAVVPGAWQFWNEITMSGLVETWSDIGLDLEPTLFFRAYEILPEP